MDVVGYVYVVRVRCSFDIIVKFVVRFDLEKGGYEEDCWGSELNFV